MDTYLDGHLIAFYATMLPLVNVPLTGYAYRAPDGTVAWIDPVDPGRHEQALLALGKPQHILVTFRDHDRAVDMLAERYGAQVWVPRGEGGSITRVDHVFGEETQLPAGLRAVSMPAMGFGEHALVTEAYGKRFAFIGDAVFRVEDSNMLWLARKLAMVNRGGPLSMKRDYRGGDTAAAPGQLRKLLDEQLDMLCVSHGKPVTSDADRALRLCLGMGT